MLKDPQDTFRAGAHAETPASPQIEKWIKAGGKPVYPNRVTAASDAGRITSDGQLLVLAIAGHLDRFVSLNLVWPGQTSWLYRWPFK